MAHQTAPQAEGRALLGGIVADRLPGAGIDEGPMFSTVGWRVGGRVFAFVGGGGDLIVKLPADRVGAVEASGAGERMTLGTRSMREWLALPFSAGATWGDFVVEAHGFVARL